jgi:hypothetical protein
MDDNDRSGRANSTFRVARRVPLHRYEIVRTVTDRAGRRKSNQKVAAVRLRGF